MGKSVPDSPAGCHALPQGTSKWELNGNSLKSPHSMNLSTNLQRSRIEVFSILAYVVLLRYFKKYSFTLSYILWWWLGAAGHNFFFFFNSYGL